MLFGARREMDRLALYCLRAVLRIFQMKIWINYAPHADGIERASGMSVVRKGNRLATVDGNLLEVL
ncbi:MAG: hypothetical protein HGB34_00185 [Candidatus Moranbacteria bacterium]|nr:hypothetical protein [Candidatus Moranbacteria bacterium]